MTVAPTSVGPGRGRHESRWPAAILAFFLGGLAVALLYHFEVFGGSSSSTTDGSGIPATQVRHLPPFDTVELAGSNNVLIRVGGKRSVLVRADDNLIDRVTTKAQSHSLVVTNTPGSFSTKSPMRVEVTVPALRAVTLSGSGNVTGGGRSSRLEITVSGSGTVRFTRLVAVDARAVVSGSGSIFVTATRRLDASVSGSGAILYFGSPRHVTRGVTGTGAITGG